MSRVDQYLDIKEDADYFGTPTAYAFVRINSLVWHQKLYLAWLMLLDAVCKR